ncbi:hypothetical protein FS749_004003 [Ceratobasidium sp. UAMH 11750]|nr:hypothetical protein FS749_004003 [Ceratobasidium sp. UAMH 11750]
MMEVDSPDNHTPNIYSQTFNRWKTIYEQLTSTFDSFLAETISLDLAFQQPGAREWSGLEDSLVRVDTAFASLGIWTSRIRDTRSTLGTIRNQSRSLVPLGRLPNEREDELYQPSPLVSVSVASKWLRSITKSAPSLWTHIDLAIGEPYEAACLRRGRSYLRYSEQRPLYVHIIHTKHGFRDAGVINLLAPHAYRIALLDLQIDEFRAEGIVLKLFGNIASCQIKEFCLNDYTEHEEPDPNPCGRFFDGRLAEFFRSLQVVSVYGPALSLDSAAFRGLTALKFIVNSAAGFPPPLAQLRDILVACPGLRALTIAFYWLQVDPEMPVEPVFLPQLELLDLRRENTDELLGLVSCIIPGSNALTFGASFNDMPEGEITVLQNFIKQSNVTKLLLDSPSLADIPTVQPFPRFTTKFPAVQELALAEYDLQRLATERSLDTFPSLHTLHLLHCKPDPDSYHQLLDSSSVQVVYADESSYEKLSEVGSSVQYRSYFSACQGEGYLEWPLNL